MAQPVVLARSISGVHVDSLVTECLVIKTGGAEILTTDNSGNISTTKGLTSTGATSGIGYATGAGGAVTQATSITTGVTLNTVCGTITTFAAGAIAGAEDGPFTVTNSAVAATDVISVSIKSYAGTGTPLVYVSATAAGSFDITITNLHAANALTAAIVINFFVNKSVAA